MKWLAILNPAAHNGAGREQLRYLARALQRRLGAQCEWTSRPEHAREIAHSSQRFEGCIAVGGDGTIYEVINGLDLKRQYLGIVPTGTGNGLARDLHVLDISSALRSLETPRLVPLDLIKVRYHVGQSWHERYIIHTSGVGYIAEVVALGIGPLKWLRYLRYAAAACVQCCRQQAFVARMRIDDQPTQDCLLTNLVVNNTRYAGPFCLFPSASVQDGRLDLLFGRIPPFSQLLEDLGILTQTYFLEWSQRARGQTVELELSKSAPLMLDGEVIANVDAVRFQLDRGCLNCVTGPASHQTERQLAGSL